MALNNIQLNPALLKEMYSNFLVDVKDTGDKKTLPETAVATSEKTSSLKEWRILGRLKKNILIVVRYPNNEYLPDDQLNFLVSVLAACRLSLDDVGIVNISKAPSAFYKETMEKFAGTTAMLFGLTPQEFEMPVNFPEFQVQNFNNCIFLHAPTLEKLEVDKILKSKLWVSLRKIFNLS
jgi:hypothetical protein